MEDWRMRCDWCGWPLKERVEDGCIAENCSMRPLPELSELGKRQQEIRKLEHDLTEVTKNHGKITCAYCGFQTDYDGTDAGWQAAKTAIADHILSCASHPLMKVAMDLQADFETIAGELAKAIRARDGAIDRLTRWEQWKPTDEDLAAAKAQYGDGSSLAAARVYIGLLEAKYREAATDAEIGKAICREMVRREKV